MAARKPLQYRLDHASPVPHRRDPFYWMAAASAVGGAVRVLVLVHHVYKYTYSVRPYGVLEYAWRVAAAPRARLANANSNMHAYILVLNIAVLNFMIE